MEKKIHKLQMNTAYWEIYDFNQSTNCNVDDFCYFFYKVAKALGYDSAPFVEFMESKLKKECAEVIAEIKISEGW